MVREMNEDLWYGIDRSRGPWGADFPQPEDPICQVHAGSPFPAFVLLIQHDSVITRVIIKLNSFVIIFIRCIQFIEHRPAINVQFLL
jgi:hypothetical protein